MKVLLDENLPHRLRNALGTHEVFTVRFLGWSGLKNGALLSAAESGGFQVFLTGDQTVSYEQNLSDRQIAVVVLSAIEWHLIRHGLPAIQAAVDVAAAGSLQMIDVGTFRRRTSRSDKGLGICGAHKQASYYATPPVPGSSAIRQLTNCG